MPVVYCNCETPINFFICKLFYFMITSGFSSLNLLPNVLKPFRVEVNKAYEMYIFHISEFYGLTKFWNFTGNACIMRNLFRSETAWVTNVVRESTMKAWIRKFSSWCAKIGQIHFYDNGSQQIKKTKKNFGFFQSRRYILRWPFLFEFLSKQRKVFLFLVFFFNFFTLINYIM